MSEEQARSLEMRVAELEDKLARLSISEEEWQSYQKVAALMAGQPGVAPTPQPIPTPQPAPVGQCIISQCIISQCIQRCIISQCIQRCIISQCIQRCIISQCIVDCTCGPCAGASSIGSGPAGGFGTLGF